MPYSAVFFSALRTDLLAHHQLRSTAMTKEDATTLVASEPTLPGLPPEVRERILFFALPSAGQKNLVVCRVGLASPHNNLTANGKCTQFHNKKCPGIALVNKKISDECVNLLQKTKNFGFCSSTCLRSFSTAIHGDLARTINKISCKEVISSTSHQPHQRPLNDLLTNVHASVRLAFRPTIWRSVLTLDLVTPQRCTVATLMVEAHPSTKQEDPGQLELKDVEVYDLNQWRKESLGTFAVTSRFDEDVLAERDALLLREWRAQLSSLSAAATGAGGLTISFFAVHI